jgi:hypothetical protein
LELRGEYFIFPNVRTEGEAAGVVGNEWEGGRLRWYHKKASRPDWPSVKKLLDAGRAHVFWRRSPKDLFEYAGWGRIEEVFGSSPVGILWSFENLTSDSGLLRTLEQTAEEMERQTGARHEFQIGDRVRHADLGWGRVLAIAGSEITSLATLYFAGVGEKREMQLSEVEKVAGFGPASV